MASSTQTGAVYGIGTYGTSQYGIASISIAVDGVQAVGTTDPDIVITADANHVITSVQGVSANGGIGQVVGNAVEEPTGVQATGTVDTVTVAHNARPTFAGVEGTGAVSTLTITTDSNVEITAPDSIGSGVDQAIVVADSNFEVSGVEGTTVLGTPTQVTVNRVPVTGVEGTGEVPLIDGSGPSFTAEGSAQLSTAQQKFGSASLLLDGTDDFVTSVENIDLSSNDFTIDVWIRPDSVTGYKGIWQSGTSVTAQSYLLGNQVYWTVTPSTIIISSVTVSTGVWTLLSYEREGNTHRIYKNGTLEATGTTSNKQDNGVFTVGKNGFGDFDGYIDEVRLSTVARYTGSSFTEPTSAFTVDGDTPVLLHFDGADTSTDIINERTASAVLVEGDANFSLTSVSATIITDQPDVVTDDVTVDADANVSVTGVEATVSPGTVTISDSAQPTFDSLTITSVVSDVTISATQNVFDVANRSAVRLARVPPAPPRIVYVGRAA